ncbi:MAG: flagellin lysine-N-methylase [Candidatus Korobacteraceae bacterium]
MSDALLQPHYADAFRCIGSDCDDNCCGGWTVFVDKATYKKYRATPSLRQLTAKHLERVAESRDTFKYARIRLRDGRCPFLAADKLCSIQKRHGAEFLSKTCSRYPRAWMRFDGRLQKALLLSCPEAARLVLLSPQLLPAVESLEDSQNTSESQKPSLAQHLRCLALGLLQERNYPLWQRLFVLGIVCRRIGELIAVQAAAKAPQLIAQYAGMMLRGELRTHLDGIPVRLEPQLDLVMRLIRLRFQVEQPRDDFAKMVAEFLLSINYSPGTPPAQSAALYADAHTRYYRPFAQQHPAFLENYLVNYIFCSRFPFAGTAPHTGSSVDPVGAFLLMASHYRLLHSLLIGSAARYREGFSNAHATRVVQVFARAVEHNFRFLEELRTLLASSNLQQTDMLALLLRNQE